MNVLVITPMLKEYHVAREIFSAVEAEFSDGYRLSIVSTRENRIFILQCGFNPEAAAKEFSLLYPLPGLLIDSGSCAALEYELSPGEIIYGNKIINKNGEQRDCISYSKHEKIKNLRDLTVLEVEKPVQDETVRNQCKRYANICTMESYRLMEVAEKWSSAYIILRSVTDYGDSNSKRDFKENFRPSCQKLYSFISDFLKNISH